MIHRAGNPYKRKPGYRICNREQKVKMMAQSTFFQELSGTTTEIISQIRKLIKAGAVRRMMIKNKDGKVLIEVPLTAGIAGATMLTAMAPITSAIGLYAMFINDVQVVVEREPEAPDANGTSERDEYEVDAEIIDIDDEEEEEDEENEQ